MFFNYFVLVQSCNVIFNTFGHFRCFVFVELFVKLVVIKLSVLKHSYKYLLVSMITVDEPLSAGLMMMSLRLSSLFKVIRSCLVRLSLNCNGLRLRMSCSMALI